MSDTQTMSGHPLSIVPLEPSDWSTVRAIYLEGIATGNSTFEKAAPEWADWDRSHIRHCRLAAHCNDEIVGWAALTPVSGRCVYAGVAEVSVYVAARVRRQRVGLELLSALVAASERAGIWTLQAGVFPENAASLALHRAAGFREVGLRERLGQMTYGPLSGEWRDVVLLERRSAIAGR